MKIIIGLGNPGTEYTGSRHNAGVMLVDKFYESKFMNYEYGFRRKKDIFVYESDSLVLVKTANVFMNESEKIIFELKQSGFFNSNNTYSKFGEGGKLENLFIAHDDLDLKLGEYKIQYGVGPKVHNGVLAIERALGTREFWRIRIGIDNRQTPTDGETYVLQRFTKEESEIINNVLIKAINEIA
jgi:peptidyl-tRNA hydrolase, PTH1 family